MFSSRGVQQTVVRRCVWSRNLVNEEALAHWGLSPQKQTKQIMLLVTESAYRKSGHIRNNTVGGK
jgi:hypothetical protein